MYELIIFISSVILCDVLYFHLSRVTYFVKNHLILLASSTRTGSEDIGMKHLNGFPLLRGPTLIFFIYVYIYIYLKIRKEVKKFMRS